MISVGNYRELLKEVKLMQLATVHDNKPWLCNVWFVADSDDNVYWISRETRRHSQDILINTNIAATFHLWLDGGLGHKGQALVVAGQAAQLRGEQCRKPYDLYATRFPAVLQFQSLDSFLGDTGHHFFYRLVPDEIVWFDEVNFPDDPRRVIKSSATSVPSVVK